MKPPQLTRKSWKARGEQATIPISLSHEPLGRRPKLTGGTSKPANEK